MNRSDRTDGPRAKRGLIGKQDKRTVKAIANNLHIAAENVRKLAEIYSKCTCTNCCDPPGGSYDPLPTEGVQFNGQTIQRATGVTAYITPAMVGQARTNFNRSGPPWWNAFKQANPVTGLRQARSTTSSSKARATDVGQTVA